jgi:hypothetical protein
MYPIYHFIFSIALSGFLWPILGWKLALFWLGSFFIDIDHWWWCILKFKKFSLKYAYDYSKKYKNLSGKLHIFHTVEFWVLLWIWSMFGELGYIIFLGVVYHNIIDLVYCIQKGRYNGRALTFIGWIYS